VTFKSTSKVIQAHSNWCYSKA